MMQLTCSAPQDQEHATERHQHLMFTFPKHAGQSHPCFCPAYIIHGAIVLSFQERWVPASCVACLADLRIPWPITQCVNSPDVFSNAIPKLVLMWWDVDWCVEVDYAPQVHKERGALPQRNMKSFQMNSYATQQRLVPAMLSARSV